MTAPEEEETKDVGPPPPKPDEGLDLLNQAFAEASSKGLVVLAAKIAGGTARILGQNQFIAELSAQQQRLELERVDLRAKALKVDALDQALDAAREMIGELERQLAQYRGPRPPVEIIASDPAPEAPPG